MQLTFPCKRRIWPTFLKINDDTTLNFLDKRLKTLVQHSLCSHAVRSPWDKNRICAFNIERMEKYDPPPPPKKLFEDNKRACEYLNLLWLHTFGWWRTHRWGRCQVARCLQSPLQGDEVPAQTTFGPNGRALWWARCQPGVSSEEGAAVQGQNEAYDICTFHITCWLQWRKVDHSNASVLFWGIIFFTSSGTPELCVSLLPSVIVMITEGSRKKGLRP